MKIKVVSVSTFVWLLAGMFILAFCCRLAQVDVAGAETGLVGCWKFNEASGQIAYDSSGNGNDGQIFGARWVDGKTGAGLRFDGQDDYVEVQHSPSLNVSSFTVMAWVKIDKFPGYYGGVSMIVAKGIDDTQNGHFGLHQYYQEHDPSNPAIFHSYLRESDQFYTVDGFTKVAVGEWYHVAGTYDGTALEIYIDGVLEDSNIIGVARTYNPGNLLIGALTNPSRGYWTDGIIDEVRLYSRALNQEEIMAHIMQTSAVSLLKLYGGFDYYSNEDAMIKICAVIENTIAAGVVPNANITLKIYYPNGTLLISENMTETLLNPGIYEWQSNKTIAEMNLDDGVYLALAEVWVEDISVATNVLLFHINSPLEGPVGPQGEPGATGPLGPQGIQGIEGPRGEKGDIGSYPLEAVALNLGLSGVSIVASIIAVSIVYKMRKSAH